MVADSIASVAVKRESDHSHVKPMTVGLKHTRQKILWHLVESSIQDGPAARCRCRISKTMDRAHPPALPLVEVKMHPWAL